MATERKQFRKTVMFRFEPISLRWALKIYLCAQVSKSNGSIHDLTDAAATKGDSVSEEDSLLIRRQRRQRAKYTSRQLHELEVEFERNPYPNAWERETLSHKLGIHETRIQVEWTKIYEFDYFTVSVWCICNAYRNDVLMCITIVVNPYCLWLT